MAGVEDCAVLQHKRVRARTGRQDQDLSQDRGTGRASSNRYYLRWTIDKPPRESVTVVIILNLSYCLPPVRDELGGWDWSRLVPRDRVGGELPSNSCSCDFSRGSDFSYVSLPVSILPCLVSHCTLLLPFFSPGQQGRFKWQNES